MAECKLTPEIEKVIIKNLKKGATYETAAQAVGISRQTLHNWIREGENGNPDFLHFLQNIKETRAEVELDLIEVVYDASKKEPDHAKWLLSHINQEAWGNKTEQKIEHTGTVNQQIQFTVIDKIIKDEDAKPATNPTDSVKADPGDKDTATAQHEPKKNTP